MDFMYYIVNKKDMTIINGAEDMLSAIKLAQQLEFDCIIFQGAVITEISQNVENENTDVSVEETE